MLAATKEKLSGWGNYPVQESNIYRPNQEKQLHSLLQQAPHSMIARGLGRSYGDTALNQDQGVILNEAFDHFLSFDEGSGLLECEAGVTLAEIISFFLPRGYWIPVTPGTKHISLAGAIANDVHGKNHHRDGSIAQYILDFSLMIASGEILHCSREQHQELFWATIGGIGLTGIIVKVRIQLQPVDSSYLLVEHHQLAHLDQVMTMMDESDIHYHYSVAWIDCLARGKSLGRSILMRANHHAAELLPKKITHPLALTHHKRELSIPFYLPGYTLNRYSIQAFNTLYYTSFAFKKRPMLVDYNSFFYPLDSIKDWNRLYGKQGFVQYQALFPLRSSREGLVALLEKISTAKRTSFLAVLKKFGPGNQGLLSFPYAGYTLALDIPIHDQDLFPFLRQLDQMVLHYGGRVYLGKDSCLHPDDFRFMYPTYSTFLKVKRKYDPQGIFSSSQARRLGLMEEWK